MEAHTLQTLPERSGAECECVYEPHRTATEAESAQTALDDARPSVTDSYEAAPTRCCYSATCHFLREMGNRTLSRPSYIQFSSKYRLEFVDSATSNSTYTADLHASFEN